MNAEEIKVQDIIEISKKAGKAIIEVQNKGFKIENKISKTFKEGFSPLTEADLVSNKIINESLSKLYPEIPILSEENKEIPYEERKNWRVFWLVDPLDGTKEFSEKGGEFTVNIALIKENKPVLGVVYVPAKELVYYNESNSAYFQLKNNPPVKINLNKEHRKEMIVVASKHHLNQETLDFIGQLTKENNVEFVSIGSSLKFCLVAEGKADIYPRLGPTMEWDTAAAHAIVNAAGKKVYKFDSQEELEYNKENLLNPWFIVK